MRYQQRYQAYAKSNNKTPDEMLTHDQAQYPGGVMCGYILKKILRKLWVIGNILN